MAVNVKLRVWRSQSLSNVRLDEAATRSRPPLFYFTLYSLGLRLSEGLALTVAIVRRRILALIVPAAGANREGIAGT